MQNSPPPDLIILDIIISGKECLLQIRQNRKLDSAPVIMLSMLGNKVDVNFCLTNGAVLCFEKPIFYAGFEEIAKEICRYLITD